MITEPTVEARDGVAADPGCPADFAGRWWVLHTRARNEKLVARALAERGVAHYLPLLSVQHTYAKGTASYTLPLFPGYLFLCGEPADCDLAWRTNRVANVLDVTDQGRLVSELTQIHRALTRGANIKLLAGIQPGQRCRVRAGPLRDLEGIVVRNGHGCRMYLSVSLLSQSAVIEIDANLLERIE